MGKRRIEEVALIEDQVQRNVTFCKRKKGLLKKAMELSILCGQEMCLVIYDSKRSKLAMYNSTNSFNTSKIDYLYKALAYNDHFEKYTNQDYDEICNSKVTCIQSRLDQKIQKLLTSKNEKQSNLDEFSNMESFHEDISKHASFQNAQDNKTIKPNISCSRSSQYSNHQQKKQKLEKDEKSVLNDGSSTPEFENNCNEIDPDQPIRQKSVAFNQSLEVPQDSENLMQNYKNEIDSNNLQPIRSSTANTTNVGKQYTSEQVAGLHHDQNSQYHEIQDQKNLDIEQFLHKDLSNIKCGKFNNDSIQISDFSQNLRQGYGQNFDNSNIRQNEVKSSTLPKPQKLESYGLDYKSPRRKPKDQIERDVPSRLEFSNYRGKTKQDGQNNEPQDIQHRGGQQQSGKGVGNPGNFTDIQSQPYQQLQLSQQQINQTNNYILIPAFPNPIPGAAGQPSNGAPPQVYSYDGDKRQFVPSMLMVQMPQPDPRYPAQHGFYYPIQSQSQCDNQNYSQPNCEQYRRNQLYPTDAQSQNQNQNQEHEKQN